MEQSTIQQDVIELDLAEMGLVIGCCELPSSLRLSETEATELSAMFKAISHPVRLQMVELISRLGGHICVCDIEGQFDLAQPTISHHLKILRKADLIDCERRGQWLFYFTRRRGLLMLNQFLTGLIAEE